MTPTEQILEKCAADLQALGQNQHAAVILALMGIDKLGDMAVHMHAHAAIVSGKLLIEYSK